MKAELSPYHQGLLQGSCGGIKAKHFQLREVLRKKGIKSWDSISNYMRDKVKYDEWTLRDIDKVYVLLNG